MANEVRETWENMGAYCNLIKMFMEESHSESEYRRMLWSLHDNIADDYEILDIEFDYSR